MRIKYKGELIPGVKTGYFTLVEPGPPDKRGRSQWVCRCVCGTIKTVSSNDLRNGTQSCGCRQYADRTFDLKGSKFNKLKVIAYVEKKSGHRRWLCVCECGNQITRGTTCLVKGRARSCGCDSKGKTGERVITDIYNRYRVRARKCGVPFDIDREFFGVLITMPCHYCGVYRGNTAKLYNSSGASSVKYNGLDRLDPKEGYVPGNVLACCKFCNTAKLNRSYDDFYVWVCQVHSRYVHARNVDLSALVLPDKHDSSKNP